MRRRSDTKRLALCGVLAALAVALMFFGGVMPFASLACPVLASLVLIPVYAETGKKWSVVWFLAVAVLAALIAPEKESAVLFAFFGYYPMLRKLLNHLGPNALRWIAKLAYCNAAVLAAYTLMLFVFRMEALRAEFAQYETYLLAVLLFMANVTFAIYDALIGRLELFYHVKLRQKLGL
ncbi:MAG: hypothetical protein PUF80_02895 [Firmicutes bacterium]|nr:hypothetical protein [Bacillota bacterium]